MNHPTSEALAAGLRRGELTYGAQASEVTAATQLLADSLVRAGGPSTDEVRAACRILNKRRHFGDTRLLGSAWVGTQRFDGTVVKHYAQALINLSSLDAGEALLHDGLPQLRAAAAAGSDQAASEIPEYEGLLGRAAKQRFVLTGNRDQLREAIARYHQPYERDFDKHFWHGINVVALRAWQERNGVSSGAGEAVGAIASKILARVSRDYRTDWKNPWLCATASEASLALGNCEQAELWLYRFLHHPYVEPFDVESYDRQLREIWQGDVSSDRTCPDRLASIVSRHLQTTQSQWVVSSAAVKELAAKAAAGDPGLEKNFSGEGTFSLDMVQRMLASCASIGCVSNKKGARLGTGFLVQGSWLKEAWGAEPVFVTNAHVISDADEKAIPSAQALVSFEVEAASAEMPTFYPVVDVLFTSPPGEVGKSGDAGDLLDVTIVRLKNLPATYTPLKPARALPLIGPRTRAYVVGHPLGGGMQISLHDSSLLDYDDVKRLMHYRTPSEPGSSGSPVFNEKWEVIALHHAGSAETPRLHGAGSYEANEGIVLSAIRAKVGA